jgi:hypothetical protein
MQLFMEIRNRISINMKSLVITKTLFMLGFALSTVFANGQYSKLIDFTGPNGAAPAGSPIMVDSFIYGTTTVGGLNQSGVIL